MMNRVEGRRQRRVDGSSDVTQQTSDRLHEAENTAIALSNLEKMTIKYHISIQLSGLCFI